MAQTYKLSCPGLSLHEYEALKSELREWQAIGISERGGNQTWLFVWTLDSHPSELISIPPGCSLSPVRGS